MQDVSFQHFKYIMPFLSASKVSVEKSADNLTGYPFICTVIFFVCIWNSLFIFNFCHFNYDFFMRIDFSSSYWGPSVLPVYLNIYFLLQFWEVFSYYFLKYIFDPRSNCQHLLDHGKSKRVPEKHLFLLY